MAGKERDYYFRGNQEKCGTFTIVPDSDFDTVSHIVPKDIEIKIAHISQEMESIGYKVSEIQDSAATASQKEARSSSEKIHDCAALLYSQWEFSLITRDKVRELSLARLFNGLTKSARALHAKYTLFDTAHIQVLSDILRSESQQELRGGQIDLQRIADAIHTAGNQRTHEKSWPWVVLPTFPQQHYGRVLLQRVITCDERYPTFITQPTFLDGEATLFHTHGQNWAFARPLGNSSSLKNTHINTFWQPHSEHNVFPLRQTDKTLYSSSNVVIIPPRSIHGISGGRTVLHNPRSLDELRKNADCVTHVKDTRFGESSSLHVYYPDQKLVQELEDSPLINSNSRFFIENDMIVFDEKKGKIWSGGGGAWPRRMMTYGPSGEHCGACFTENDSRQEHLDEDDILEWYTQRETERPIVFKYSVS